MGVVTAPTCTRCGRPTADGYACSPCVNAKGRGWLAEIADMAPAARDIAHRLSSSQGGSGGSGKPGSRLPLDLGAMAKLDAVERELGTWMRHVAEERGVSPDVSHWHDPIEGLATKLCNHLEWWRHRAEVDAFLADVEACARVVRGIARGPAEQKYLGPCGALIVENYERAEVDGVLHESATTRQCDGDVYGHRGGGKGRCRECGAEVDQAQRAAWLDEQTADLAAPARDIAYALDLSVKTIRSWATEVRAENGTVIRRAHLRTYYRLGEHVVPWTELDDKLSEAERKALLAQRGPRLHYVGDVRKLAAEAAERRVANETRRNREGAAA